jgi:hypothetical protein
MKKRQEIDKVKYLGRVLITSANQNGRGVAEELKLLSTYTLLSRCDKAPTMRGTGHFGNLLLYSVS